MSALRLLSTALAVLALTLASALAQNSGESPNHDKGLLWRVEHKGAPPSFLFGTLHDDDDRVARLAPQVQRAFDRSTRFAVELIDDEAAVARFRRAMVRKAPQLDTLLGEADWPRYDERLAAHGMPRDARAHLKPWAALLILVRPAESPGIVLDKLLLIDAKQRGKDITALETIDEQIAAMNDLPEDSQFALLRHAEANYDRIQQSFAALRDAYLARDLAAIWKLNLEMMAGGDDIEPHSARFLDSLLYQRNQRFAERLVPLLERGGAFAAFGALHLYGPRGVPALLAARGYKVTRIY
jgi:uncharacterized protein YbaP (TraB family)